MSRPKVEPVRELLIPAFTQWDRVGSVTSILAELEQGQFYNAALLVDQMMRDDRVRATMNVRLMALFGMPLHFESADHSTKRGQTRAGKIAEAAEEAWPTMAPQAETMALLQWGLMLGVGVARKNWQRTADGWVPVIQTWHPGAVRFDLFSSTYMLRTYDQGEIPIVPGDPNWLLFTPFGHKYGRLNGMIRSLAMLYLCRQWAFRDRARHSEVHGQPTRALITPAEVDQRDKDVGRRAMASIGTESALELPQGQDGNKWDYKLIEASSDSHQTFSAQIDHLDDAIAIAVLGQKTSTKGASGLGSDQNPGDVVRRDIMRFDAKCVGDIGCDVLSDWSRFNYGDQALAPEVCIDVEQPEDGKKTADEYSVIGDAVAKLEPHGLDVRALLEQIGVPLLSPAAAAAAKEEAQQAAMEEAQAATPASPGTQR